METWGRDYIRHTLDFAEVFAHEHKGQSPDDFKPNVGNLWLELSSDLDALLGCYGEELEDQVKLRIESFLKGGWLEPQSLAEELDIEEKTSQFLDMPTEVYMEHLRRNLEDEEEKCL